MLISIAISLFACLFGFILSGSILIAGIIPVETHRLLLGVVFGTVVGYILLTALDHFLGKWSRNMRETFASLLGFAVGSILSNLCIGMGFFCMGQPITSSKIVMVYIFLMNLVFGYAVGRLFLKYESRVAATLLLGKTLKVRLIKIVDTSAIIDGRILGILKAKFFDGAIIIPGFVMKELRLMADSQEEARSDKGMRGIGVVGSMLEQENVRIYERDYSEIQDVDDKLVKMAEEMNGTLITLDSNLASIAEARDVFSINIHELSCLLKTVLRSGDVCTVQIVRKGKQKGQGLAFLDDGSMIVVDNSIEKLGQTVQIEIANVVSTDHGMMYFSNLVV